MHGKAPFAFFLLLALPAAGPAHAAGATGSAGATLYNAKCALCHGRDGTPAPALAGRGVRTFKDAQWQSSKTDAELAKSIEEGKPGTLMRAFKEELKADQIAALVAYIRTFKTAAK